MIGPLKRGLIYILVIQMMVPVPPVYAANIQVDPSQSQTHTDKAQNGVDVVNISKPSQAGVSKNKFTEYNVGSSGVILNNSTHVGVSQLGGALGANPNFTGDAADIVMFEVTGTNRSDLRGYTEMFGQSADFILANPNGIYVNGAGFINVPRATLTTGRPDYDANDHWQKSFSVDSGIVEIEGLGMNVSNVDYFDIVTRVAKINAAIYAGEELSIITGRNDYDYATRTHSAKADDGSDKPTFAIDASALGAMVANRIKLVSTEQGVGVNTQADVIALTGDIVIDSEGNITNSGQLSSRESTNISGADFTNTGLVFGLTDVDIDLSGTLVNDQATLT